MKGEDVMNNFKMALVAFIKWYLTFGDCYVPGVDGRWSVVCLWVCVCECVMDSVAGPIHSVVYTLVNQMT